MLSETIAQLPVDVAFGLAGGMLDKAGSLSDLIHGPTSGADIARGLLRWVHFVAGVGWIGLLYFFNLVNVPTMAALDGPTKKQGHPRTAAPRAVVFSLGCSGDGAGRYDLLRHVYRGFGRPRRNFESLARFLSLAGLGSRLLCADLLFLHASGPDQRRARVGCGGGGCGPCDGPIDGQDDWRHGRERPLHGQ